MDYKAQLRSHQPAHEFFAGIDSDGCVFDSMEIKQKEFFIPEALKHFNLFPVSKYLRQTWEFVNLYSAHRGINRFPAIIKVFDLLSEREEVRNSGCRLPDMRSLREWVAKETCLSNATLRLYAGSKNDPDLQKILGWSESINVEMARWLNGIPAFPSSVKALEKIQAKADIIVISQTPFEALDREWEEHDLKKYISFIAAQEHGTKAEHISLAAVGKYSKDKILLVGDAFGDFEAAKENDILFYPIIPGKEESSWQKLIEEAFSRFTEGTYKGSYENSLHKEFKKSLPDTPPWKR